MAGGAVLLSNSLLGQVKMASPNERVNLACIGIGNRANEIIKALHKTGLCNIVAVCDVDLGAKHTTEVLKLFPDARRFQDFRKMFDEMANQIDAVSVGTPDFSHFAATMMAIDYGKHVYVEKPLAHTFNEVELLMAKAAKNPKVATQMGNQGHSEANYFQFKAWKDAGIIKDVTRIDAHMNMPRRWHGWDVNMTGFPYPERIPDTLDWELWQMQTTGHHYNKDFVNGQWRCWYGSADTGRRSHVGGTQLLFLPDVVHT
jgi:predicted dehydrogenase